LRGERRVPFTSLLFSLCGQQGSGSDDVQWVYLAECTRIELGAS
jgi:hypothetical protein